VPKTPNVPGTDRPAEKAAGHWLLAQLGKKVLRPGGREDGEDKVSEGIALRNSARH